MVVTLSHGGYMKAQPLAEYRAQRRGGRGKQATATKEDDFIDQLFIANTHDYILCFSNRGRVYWLKVYEVPQGSAQLARQADRQPVPAAATARRSTRVLPVKEFAEDHYVFMATAMGTVKKTPLAEFSQPAPVRHHRRRPRRRRLPDRRRADRRQARRDAVQLDGGKAVRFDENDVRPMGRNAHGVRGMTLDKGQSVIAHAGRRGRGAVGAHRDRERLRQAHADRRVHAPRPRHARA